MFWVADGVVQMMFLRAIRRVTSQPVSGLVYSHSDGDHVGAASVFPQHPPLRAPETP